MCFVCWYVGCVRVYAWCVCWYVCCVHVYVCAILWVDSVGCPISERLHAHLYVFVCRYVRCVHVYVWWCVFVCVCVCVLVRAVCACVFVRYTLGQFCGVPHFRMAALVVIFNFLSWINYYLGSKSQISQHTHTTWTACCCKLKHPAAKWNINLLHYVMSPMHACIAPAEDVVCRDSHLDASSFLPSTSTMHAWRMTYLWHRLKMLSVENTTCPYSRVFWLATCKLESFLDSWETHTQWCRR